MDPFRGLEWAECPGLALMMESQLRSSLSHGWRYMGGVGWGDEPEGNLSLGEVEGGL